MRNSISLVITIAWALIFALIPQRSYAQDNVSLVDAVNLYDNGDYSNASLLFERILKQKRDNDAAHYYLGMSYYSLKETDKAELHLLEAVRLDDSNFWYKYRLAQFYSYIGRNDESIAIYEKLLADYPKRDDLYFDLIDIYLALGKNDEAMSTLDKIETSFGKNESTCRVRVNILNAQGKEEEALECLKAFNKDYSSPWALSVLANYEMSMYNDSTAIAYYNEALELEPAYPLAVLGKAEVYRMTRKYSEFFNQLDTIAVNPDLPAPGKSDYLRALTRSADVKFLTTYRQHIDKVIDACVATHPKDSACMITSALYYIKTDRATKGAEMFDLVRKLYPDDIQSMGNYLQSLMYAKDWDRVTQECMTYLQDKDFPERRAVFEMASSALYASGKYAELVDLCKLRQEEPDLELSDQVRICSVLGDMYHNLGKSNESLAAYEKALKLDAEDVYVLNNYAYYLSLEGRKLKKAASMSKKTIEKEPDNPTFLDTYGWILYLMGKPEEAKVHFKHAMLYGAKDSVVILDHYASVLFKLGEYDLALFYWNQILSKKDTDPQASELSDIEAKIADCKEAMKK